MELLAYYLNNTDCSGERICIIGRSDLGGEPLAQNDILDLLKRIKAEVNKPVYVWTGYTAEFVIKHKSLELSYIDYLIDGKFEEDKKDVRLRLRGSSNQKIWHILHKEEENLLLEATEEKGWRE